MTKPRQICHYVEEVANQINPSQQYHYLPLQKVHSWLLLQEEFDANTFICHKEILVRLRQSQLLFLHKKIIFLAVPEYLWTCLCILWIRMNCAAVRISLFAIRTRFEHYYMFASTRSRKLEHEEEHEIQYYENLNLSHFFRCFVDRMTPHPLLRCILQSCS